jgi:hypothetical protein
VQIIERLAATQVSAGRAPAATSAAAAG